MLERVTAWEETPEELVEREETKRIWTRQSTRYLQRFARRLFCAI